MRWELLATLLQILHRHTPGHFSVALKDVLKTTMAEMAELSVTPYMHLRIKDRDCIAFSVQVRVFF